VAITVGPKRPGPAGANPFTFKGLPPHILIGEQLPDEFGRTESGPLAGEPATLPIPNRHLVALVGEAPRMLHLEEIVLDIRLAEYGYDLIIAGAVEGIGLARCNVVAWGHFRVHGVSFQEGLMARACSRSMISQVCWSGSKPYRNQRRRVSTGSSP